MEQSASLSRVLPALLLVVVAGATAARTAAATAADALDRLAAGAATPGDVRLTAGLVLLGALGACLAWCWLLLCTLVALVDVLGSRRGRPARTTGPLRPVLLRSLLGVACVGAGALTVPAHAAEPLAPPAAVLDGLLLPERVTDQGPTPHLRHRTAPPTPPRDDGRPELCRVRPGDTLWALAEELLVRRGASPTVEDVDRAWRLLHRANRAVLGIDPDLIRPGALLRVPRPLAADGRGHDQPTGAHR